MNDVMILQKGGVPMTERDWTCFAAVAKYLNFTAAAKKLYISQPALSKQIARMEEELGFPLFLRTRQDVKLAPGGVVLLNEYQRLTGHYREMLRHARLASEGKAGELRIGIQEGQSLDEHVLELIRGFRRQYTGVELEIRSMPYRPLLDALQQDKLDVALCLRFDSKDFAGMECYEIKTAPSYAILSAKHPLASPGALTDPVCLSGETLLVVGSELVPHGAQFVLEQCRKCRITPGRVRLVSSYSTLYLWLTMGEGFAFMNQNVWYANKELYFSVLPEDLSVTQVACWRAASRNSAVPLFLEAIRPDRRPGAVPISSAKL
ncbi:MAG: LysR family transcriptional regulator [Clostridia bacterium]|nr:LysR family transcriptional regulator [Clostridia bacterium]